MNNCFSDKCTITMPHRDTVLYCDKYCEVSFEVEINSTESVLWSKFAQCIKGDKKTFLEEIEKILHWLAEKFPNRKAVVDNA